MMRACPTPSQIRVSFPALTALCLAAAGCYSQQQYDQALERSADLQVQLDQVKAALQAKTDELKTAQASTAESALAERKAARAVETFTDEARQLRKSLDIARRELESANSSLAREQAELQKALNTQREARSKTEQELADRNRQIDVLRSKVRLLEQQLDELREAAAQPASTEPARR